MVLGEVGVGALSCARVRESETGTGSVTVGARHTAVEEVGVGVLVGLLGGSIGVGVFDAAGLAELAGAQDVHGVDEEGGGGGGEDETASLAGDCQHGTGRGGGAGTDPYWSGSSRRKGMSAAGGVWRRRVFVRNEVVMVVIGNEQS